MLSPETLAVGYVGAVPKPRPYTHRRCPVCREDTDFKFLPNERDEYGRTLMVCTQCNSKRAKPGQEKRAW